MGVGGRLDIALANVAGAGGPMVEIVVRDVGTGIAAEHLSKVMDPFFSTKPLSIGSGLGLAQVSGFAQQSGGSLSIASVVGEGTSVTLLLPGRERTV
jgi:signal transduction histidine kinase